jgi:hypothetical protein
MVKPRGHSQSARIVTQDPLSNAVSGRIIVTGMSGSVLGAGQLLDIMMNHPNFINIVSAGLDEGRLLIR